MFDAMVRFVTIAILVREYSQDFMIYLTKEFSKSSQFLKSIFKGVLT